MSASPYATTPPDTDKIPGGIPFIIGNEVAERFSFYGMYLILADYLTKYLKLTTWYTTLYHEVASIFLLSSIPCEANATTN